MKVEEVLEIARLGEILKQTSRSGWALAGVISYRPESVAEHMYGTLFLASVFGEALLSAGERLDMAKVLTMAAMHDLPESITSDIPRTATEIGGARMLEAKKAVESEAMKKLLGHSREHLKALENSWKELQEGESIEARMVRSCDILDMILHATALEESGVDARKLEGFFLNSKPELEQLGIRLIQEVFEVLFAAHRTRIESS